MANPPIPLNGTLGDPLQSETKPMDEVLRLAIEGVLYNLHVALPCQVVAIRNNSYVDVQPLLQRLYTNGDLVSLPLLQNVPVSHPRGKAYWIKLPVAVGDLGTVVFCERSLDKWKVAGGLTNPMDSRRHDLSDGIFFPGMYPENDVLPGAAEDMILSNGTAEIFLQKPGRFLVRKAGGDELLKQISDLAEAVSALATAVGNLASGTTSGFGAVSVTDPPGMIAALAVIAAAQASASTAGTTAGTIDTKVTGLTGSA